MNLNIALLQMEISFGDPHANYEKAERLFEEACKKQIDVIVLPELWTTGYDLERLKTIADPNGEQTKTFFSRLAKKHQVNVIGGSVAVEKEDGIYNTLLVFNRNGDCIKDYAKAHLFRLMREEMFLSAGTSDGLFELEQLPFAGFICYDIRFPEWIRAHILQGAGIIVVPAEWPAPRIEHWRNLLISRAIENQSFVMACNRVGKDPDNEFGGHSLVINPWGEVLAEADATEQILYASIDPDELSMIRERIPVFEDRRPELYKALFDSISST
ncbi:carbon-nitrogen family hydrolase [Pullulanibacillus sp. KACC 23026]|uniref:carbon-nitrogen family hydrolase n=1 Tax=Pullulanibacillus sp. KACC 23026 TaxID=3028315 RepID=UPI0023B1E602|nr:carbon-nitrogen family hydrolase [Pullulanibacillus sp. KACC 23026]WEG12371.1 carbon-nitrogen family hydrolase [Pullulanibacillus sp. KACC 23026]